MNLAELDIWNRVYWAINRPMKMGGLLAGNVGSQGEKPAKVPDTTAKTRPEHVNLPAQDKRRKVNGGQVVSTYQLGKNNV
jgi:hypothetical protein